MLIDEALGGSAVADCRLLIEAEGDDLDIVAEALVKLINGRSLFIGAELVDVLALAEDQISERQSSPLAETSPPCNQGRAVVIEGLGYGDGAMADVAREQLNALDRAGFGRGIFLMALVGAEDEEAFSLQGFDEFLTKTCSVANGRPVAATASSEASRTGLVIFAFT